MMDENNEQFVAYFLPTEETLTKRQQDEQAGVPYSEDEVWVTKELAKTMMHVKQLPLVV